MFQRITRDRYLSDAELAAFMAAVRDRRHANQPRDYALFALLANTGIRPSEALALTRADVRLAGAEPWIRVRRAKAKHAPAPVCELPLHKKIASILRRHVRSRVFGDGCARVFPITKRQSARLFHFYRVKANIEHRCKLYGLRHSAGMRWVRTTGDLRMVQAIMGHNTLKTAAMYRESDPRMLLDAFASAGTIS